MKLIIFLLLLTGFNTAYSQTNLDSLYEYCVHTLIEANAENDMEKFDAVLKVMQQVKEGWDGIREQAKQESNSEQLK